MDCCAVRIWEIRINGSRVDGDRRSIVTNGKKLGEGSYVFDTEDPNINIRVSRYKRQERNSLEAVLEIVRLPGAIAADLCRRKKIP